jgi:nicotinamide mononucleotide transporter
MSLDALIEPLAVLTGIACVALTVRQRIVSWPIGIVSSALFLALFLRAGLYADSALQVLYIGMGFYGWWHWLHGGSSRDTLAVTSSSTGLRVVLVVGTIVATIAVGAFLDTTTD